MTTLSLIRLNNLHEFYTANKRETIARYRGTALRDNSGMWDSKKHIQWIMENYLKYTKNYALGIVSLSSSRAVFG